MAKPKALLMGVGDVGPLHPPTDRYAGLVAPVLAEADVRVANLERLYSTRGVLHPDAGGGYSRMKPEHATFIKACGFDVLSLATNHGMDWGVDALLDTADVVRGFGGVPLGAGQTLEEAQAPAIVERGGVTIGFLNYCSVFRDGYAATAKQGGISPLRVSTRYESFDYQPGVPPKVVTEPDQADLSRLLDQVNTLKKRVDCVVLSLHWGVHFVPRLIADYQHIVAHAAFDAGADLILGHHAHVAKGIEVYKGKVCFHSLGNFMITLDRTPEGLATFARKYRPLGVDLETDPAYARLPYGRHAKYSLIAQAHLTSDGVEKVSFRPVIINRDLVPEPLCNGDERFTEVVDFMSWASEGFNARLSVQGNDVLIADESATTGA